MSDIDDDWDVFIEEVIKNWVGKNFGSSEVEEPSWNITSLAGEVATAVDHRIKQRLRLREISLRVIIKDIPKKDVDKFMERAKEKIKRIGGAFNSVDITHKDFTEPIMGEMSGHVLNIKADMPDLSYYQQALLRWLHRQEEYLYM